jgi:AcrR family transcriptional regulator
MEEVARAAGVRRGLVNHYFGGKRALFLAVVEDLLAGFERAFPASGRPAGGPGRPAGEVVAEHVDRWLGVVEADAEAWFAFVSAEGFGRDADVERIVDRHRDATVERIVELLVEVGVTDPGTGPAGAGPGAGAGSRELRAALRSYSGMADAVTREWLLRRSLDRGQARTLLAATLLSLVREVVPALSPGGPPDG